MGLVAGGIVAGVTAIGTAIGAAATAVATAVASISLVTAFEIATVVGVGLSVVGAVTKNKTLMMVGGVIGAIGGIGSLATSAGLFGAEAASGASMFGAAPAASTASTADAATATTSAFGGVASDASSAATYGSTAGAFGSGGADAASAGTIPFMAEGLPPGQDSLFSGAVTSERVVADPAAVADLGEKATASVTTPDANSAFGGVRSDASSASTYGQTSPFATGDAGGTTAPSTVAGTGSDGEKSIFGKILEFADKHPTAAAGVVQAGSKLLEGMTSSLTPAQVDDYNARAAANNAQAAMSTQQRTNLAAPKAVAYSSPITGTPQQLVPGAGLMNNAPPRLAPVTGALV